MAVLGGGRDVVERSVDRALACVLVLCALMLVTRALAAAWRVVHERRIVHAWMRPAGSRQSAERVWMRRLHRHVGRGESGRHRGRAQGTPTPRELSLLVAEVATRLRAGAPTSAAWGLALARIGAGGFMPESASYPPILDEWAREPPRWELPVRARAPDVAARRTAASVALACRFSHGLGAPMADILDAIGDSIDDAQSVAEARRVASAGPLMSARVLAALPLVGIVSALALGASPWQFYTGATVGRICALLGAAAWVAGIASCRRSRLWGRDPARPRRPGRCLRTRIPRVDGPCPAARRPMGRGLGRDPGVGAPAARRPRIILDQRKCARDDARAQRLVGTPGPPGGGENTRRRTQRPTRRATGRLLPPRIPRARDCAPARHPHRWPRHVGAIHRALWRL